MIKTDLVLVNNIAYYRKERGMYQCELAYICGVSTNTISSLERGRFNPTAYLAAKLCDALEVKFEDLFYLKERILDSSNT